MQLQQYDILLKKNSKNPISKLIQLFTGDIYSHAMMVLDENHILEATYPQGVRIKHIDFHLGEFDCYRLKAGFSSEQRINIRTFIQKTLNSRYDVRELLLEAFNIEDKSNNHKYICITLCINAFRYAGIEVGTWKKGFLQISNNDKFMKVNK